MLALFLAACCIPTGPTAEAPVAGHTGTPTPIVPEARTGPRVRIETAAAPTTGVTPLRAPERWPVEEPAADADPGRYAPPGTLGRALHGSGLVAPADVVPNRRFDPVEALVEAGRVHWFDVETGSYPNRHDILLAELAWLARPDLDGAVFREDADAWREGAELSDYVLHGWHGGRHFSTTADVELGDWYDVAAVTALLDAMLLAAGSEQRTFPLYSGDQTLPLLIATPAAFERGVAAGLIRPGDPALARQVGTAAEDEAFRQLLEAGATDLERDVVIPRE